MHEHVECHESATTGIASKRPSITPLGTEPPSECENTDTQIQAASDDARESHLYACFSAQAMYLFRTNFEKFALFMYEQVYAVP